MSRSGYSDDLEPWDMIKYRGQVASAIRGKRGQRLLIELRDALDAMPEKKLIANSLERDGEVCALGAVGRARGINMEGMDPDDPDEMGEVFDVAHQLAAEIVNENDEYYRTDEQRWRYMRGWVQRQIQGEG